MNAGLSVFYFYTATCQNYSAFNYSIDMNIEAITPNLLVVHSASLLVRNFNASNNQGQVFYFRSVLNQEFYDCTFQNISLYPKREQENIPFLYSVRNEDDLPENQTLENPPIIIFKNFNVYVSLYNVF